MFRWIKWTQTAYLRFFSLTIWSLFTKTVTPIKFPVVWLKLKVLFDDYDADGSGCIDPDEMFLVLCALEVKNKIQKTKNKESQALDQSILQVWKLHVIFLPLSGKSWPIFRSKIRTAVKSGILWWTCFVRKVLCRRTCRLHQLRTAQMTARKVFNLRNQEKMSCHLFSLELRLFRLSSLLFGLVKSPSSRQHLLKPTPSSISFNFAISSTDSKRKMPRVAY